MGVRVHSTLRRRRLNTVAHRRRSVAQDERNCAGGAQGWRNYVAFVSSWNGKQWAHYSVVAVATAPSGRGVCGLHPVRREVASLNFVRLRRSVQRPESCTR
ncbi:hypothetical protein V9T40_006622 [Parthenolecanium corni]|uniref:Uncharacterized protein n=1 Tax=Parthenolecanium corni TaxID=536013 RepID=A0AAN9U1R5_9HEMI